MIVEVNDGKEVHVFTEHTQMADVMRVIGFHDRQNIAKMEGYPAFRIWTMAVTQCLPHDLDDYPEQRATFMPLFLTALQAYLSDIAGRVSYVTFKGDV